MSSLKENKLLGTPRRILDHEVLDGGVIGTTFKSISIDISTEAGWVLVVQIGATPTGTSPGIVWEVDLKTDSGSYTRVGGAISATTDVALLTVPYFANSTQGKIITAYANTHIYLVQVKGVLANADNVFSDVSVALVPVE